MFTTVRRNAMIDAGNETQSVGKRTRHRWLRWPLIRISIATVFVIVPFIILQIILQKLPIDKALKQVWPTLLSAACCYGMYIVYVRTIEGRAAHEFAPRYAIRETGSGLIGGSVLFCAILAVLYLMGAFHITNTASWTVLIAPFFGMIVVGFLEEILFRGIVFRILQEWLGSWIALLLSVLVFALAHASNPGVTPLALASVAAAGLLLGAAYMLTGRLWLGIGFHIGWNFTQGGLFSVPVSGQPAKGMLQGELSGPDWLTGGMFGVEGSAVALIVVLTGAIALLAFVKRDRVRMPAWSASNQSNGS
jgi:membrane protease YdiL (CAAX protease family)